MYIWNAREQINMYSDVWFEQNRNIRKTSVGNIYDTYIGDQVGTTATVIPSCMIHAYIKEVYHTICDI